MSSRFSSLSLPGVTPGNIPIPPTPLLAREKEVASLVSLLRRPDTRLVTLTGPGGVGKTRLALQVAADLTQSFRQGVSFINLTPISDPSLVISTIAQTLDIGEHPGKTTSDALIEYLTGKEMLLVLDNFEQIAPAAPQLAQLLSMAPGLKMLVTSRDLLHIRGEHNILVSPLTLADPAHLPSVDQLAQYGAIRLFVERATAIKHDFTLNDDNALTVAEICSRLDGLPLAIELAAARIRLLAPQAMLARLQNTLQFLTGGARDLPLHQQTLLSTIAWSYDLLTHAEQQLFRRFAVFVGGRTLEAIEAVCAANGDLEIELLDGIESLLSKSLLQERPATDGQSRFWMLESIYEYARDRLGESGEAAELRDRHALYFVGLAEAAEPHLRGAEQKSWLDRLDAERNNLRTALEWTTNLAAIEEHEKREEIGLRLAGALQRFWEIRGPISEGRSWLARLLKQADSHSNPNYLAKALTGAGTLAYRQGDYGEAISYHSRALDLYRELGDKQGIAFALNNVAVQYYCTGDWEHTASHFVDALAIYRELGDQKGIAMMLNNLGETLRLSSNYAGARVHFEEALTIRKALGDGYGTAMTLMNLAHVADYEDDLDRAVQLFREALQVCIDVGDNVHIALTLTGLGGILGLRGNTGKAATLLGAAEALSHELGVTFSRADRLEQERKLGAILALVSDRSAFEQNWAEGRAMTVPQAIAFALEPETTPAPQRELSREYVAPTAATIASSTVPWHEAPRGLTRRELEVLRLVSHGLTDPQIADRLALSVRTVENHLRSIYSKLDVSTRTEATRLAYTLSIV